MNKLVLLMAVIILIAGSLVGYTWFRQKSDETPTDKTEIKPTTKFKKSVKKEVKAMKIASKAFSDSETIPDSFTCKGANINPLLTISDVPDSAKSLVLIMDDPDAPSGTANPGWVHWVIFNIDPSTTEIAEDSVPAGGILGVTDFGNARYGGPCPPSGTHHYHFSLFALDSLLGLSNGASKSDVEAAMANHVITKSDLIGLVSK